MRGCPSASWPSALSSGTYWAQWACGHAPVCDVVQAPSLPGLSPVASVGRACQVVVAPFLLLQGPEGGGVIKARAPLCWRRCLDPWVRLTSAASPGSKPLTGGVWKGSVSSLEETGISGSVAWSPPWVRPDCAPTQSPGLLLACAQAAGVAEATEELVLLLLRLVCKEGSAWWAGPGRSGPPR